MDIQDIVKMQRDFDQQHGWGLESVPAEKRLVALERETLGLCGEVGELANKVKRARLRAGRIDTEQKAFEDVAKELPEELTDVLIYLVRLFNLVDADIGANYLQKLAFNNMRFKEYEG